MKIYVNRSCMVMHISVMGEFDATEDLKEFFEYLDENDNSETHITFLDANIVPDEVVDKLFTFQKSKKCRIYVLKTYLYSYFYSLGIKCLYVKKKSIQQSSYKSQGKPVGECLDHKQVLGFLNDINEKYGYDYTQYQIESIIRRIKITMLRYGADNFDEFKREVLEDQDMFEQLFLDFSINTTEFFRDAEVYAELRQKIFPYLNSYTHFKIWCVGCSNGKEPYSVAIILSELGLLDKVHIYATDINPYVIEEAKNGLYALDTIAVDTKSYKEAGGVKNFNDYFEIEDKYIKVKSFLKERILFFQHSLVEPGILNEFQLILCRNVMIYFDTALQKKVLEHFYNSLDISGFLVLGKSEGMLQNEGYRFFDKYDENKKVYRKKP